MYASAQVVPSTRPRATSGHPIACIIDTPTAAAAYAAAAIDTTWCGGKVLGNRISRPMASIAVIAPAAVITPKSASSPPMSVFT
ncbi:MAG TPA: hypothetical protein VF640_01890 [Acidimicrobiales bacterium]